MVEDIRPQQAIEISAVLAKSPPAPRQYALAVAVSPSMLNFLDRT